MFKSKSIIVIVTFAIALIVISIFSCTSSQQIEAKPRGKFPLEKAKQYIMTRDFLFLNIVGYRFVSDSKVEVYFKRKKSSSASVAGFHEFVLLTTENGEEEWFRRDYTSLSRLDALD